jgi:hypothetical protein
MVLRYLQHAEFHIITDHKSLIQLTDQRLHTPWKQKVFTRLLGLQYRIIHCKGADNSAADAPSRAPALLCATISFYQSQWLNEVLHSYQDDYQAQELLAKLSNQFDEVRRYTLQDGLIPYDGRVWVGTSLALHTKLIAALHNSAVCSHSRVLVTYLRMKQHFAWIGMKSDVHEFVTSCLTCQQAKLD